MIRKDIFAALGMVSALASGAAVAAPAEEAIEACRIAVESSVGEDAVSKLTKIKARGANYEVWLNVEADDEAKRSYCYLRRGDVAQFVVEEGKWVGRNPRRPDSVDLG